MYHPNIKFYSFENDLLNYRYLYLKPSNIDNMGNRDLYLKQKVKTY